MPNTTPIAQTTQACADEVLLMLQTIAAARPVMVATWGDATHLQEKLSAVLGDSTRHFSSHDLQSLTCIDKIPDDYWDMLIIDHTHSSAIELDRALPTVLRVLRSNATVLVFNRLGESGCPTPSALGQCLQQHTFDQVTHQHYLYSVGDTAIQRLISRIKARLMPTSGLGFLTTAKKSMTTIRTLEWETPTAADEQLAINSKRNSQ